MLPLLHSLTHLTYLTSTSPRIRDILVIDGGLERLLEILQESALPRSASSPIPDWYSLRGPHTAAVINHQQQISLRHSLAFQCVVNIGVRGSEMVRTRVVQSGALDVVAQIMEVWLQGKGMSIESGPLGSQAAVDRAAAGLQQHWYQSSRSKDRHKERDKEREKLRETRHAGTASAEIGRSRASPPPFPDSRSTTRPAVIGSTSTLPVGRVVSKESLERSLTPQDEPNPTEIIVNMLSLEQRASITRINAVARLAGIDRAFIKRAVLQPNDQSNGLRMLFRSFSLDLNVLLALEGGNLNGGAVPSGFIEERSFSRPPRDLAPRPPRMPLVEPRQEETMRAMSMTPESAGDAEDDVSMDSAGEQAEISIQIGSPRRRDTITSPERRDVPPPRQGEHTAVLEQPTPRAVLPSLPPMGINIRPRSDRMPSQDSSIRAIMEDNVGSPFASGSNSTLSSLNEQTSTGVALGSPTNEARPRERPILSIRRPSTRAIFDGGSGVSTPGIDTPPQSAMRQRSGTITNARLHQSSVSVGEASRLAAQVNDNRSASRAGTEDDESAVDEEPAQIVEQEVSIVGTTDDEVVEVLNGLVDVDEQARTQAEVDLAMGAPPGAPGATQTPRIAEMTPRQAHRTNALPVTTVTGTDMNGNDDRHETTAFAAVIAAGAPRGFSDLSDLVNVIETTTPTGEVTYNDDTILLCLQLLAYLSKYPHVRAAFHHPRRPMHPDCEIPEGIQLPERPALSRSNNMFSLVERFTFRPSGPDPDMQKLPADIQYWAGVIMRNACRKDDSNGGIRQCANVNCGRWETFPREFAKCRRCRKAKYCSKECQSKAWQEGHRFWYVSWQFEIVRLALDADGHAHTGATLANQNLARSQSLGL